jgi:hypothetical protein
MNKALGSLLEKKKYKLFSNDCSHIPSTALDSVGFSSGEESTVSSHLHGGSYKVHNSFPVDKHNAIRKQNVGTDISNAIKRNE